jgi:cold shock CspA family protein
MKDRIIEGYLKNFAEENSLSEIDESKTFEYFVNYCVGTKYIFDVFSFEDITVGAGHDTGIDGIAIIVNGHNINSKEDIDFFNKTSGRIDVQFVFVQSKTSSKFESGPIGNFIFGVKDFFEKEPSLKINDGIKYLRELKEYIYDLSIDMEKNPVCHMYYATTGKWVSDDNLTGRIDAEVGELRKTSLFSEVKFFPLDSEKLKSTYRELKHKITKEINFEKHTILPQIDNVQEAYIGILSCNEYLNFICDSEENLQKNLFYNNIRDFQGYNPVNVDIENTLKNDAQRGRFGLLNNGITIVAKAINKVGSTFKVIDYQIVNGCQTSHVLYYNKELLTDDIFIPIKIIVTNDIDITNDIIKATNWQTEVKKEAFESLSPFHKKLEEFYASFDKEKNTRLYYERRSKQYENQPIRKHLIVTLTTQIKSFLSMFLNEPHSTHRYYGELLKSYQHRLFRDDHSFYPYYTSSYAFLLLDDFFRAREINSKYRKFKYHMLLLFRLKVGGRNMPRFNSKNMDAYCKKMTDVLWNRNDALRIFQEIANKIEKALNSAESTYQIERLKKFTYQITELPDIELTRGVVKVFDDVRGFGFIGVERSKDVFVHHTDINARGYRTLSEGQHVEFILKHGDRGLKAENVQIVP